MLSSDQNRNLLSKDIYEGSGANGIRRIADLYVGLAYCFAFATVITFFIEIELTLYFIIALVASLFAIPVIRGFATIVEAAQIYKRKNGVQ